MTGVGTKRPKLSFIAIAYSLMNNNDMRPRKAAFLIKRVGHDCTEFHCGCCDRHLNAPDFSRSSSLSDYFVSKGYIPAWVLSSGLIRAIRVP